MQRQTQGSMLCPSCGKLIGVSSERCPFCGATRPGLWGFGPFVARILGGLDPVRLIPPLCIGLYVLALAVDPGAVLRGGGVELIVMRSFFRQARMHWEARLERSALHTRPIAFNSWFKRYALGIPALSVLALNSGICGDKMLFLAMFKDDSSIVSQTEFDAGVRYVDSLKVWGTDYLKDSGFAFASGDPVVTGLLKLATSHSEQTGRAGKAWKATLGFLNA
jgi:hypothetical protein